MNDSVEANLQKAIQLARSGDKAQARKILVDIVRQQPQQEMAWVWLSAVMERREDSIRCLQQVLTINPANDIARKGLSAMGITLPEATAPKTRSSRPETPPPAIPMPEIESITKAQQLSAEEIDRAMKHLQVNDRELPFVVKDVRKSQPVSLPKLEAIPLPRTTLIPLALSAVGVLFMIVAGISLLNNRGPRIQASNTDYIITPRIQPTLVATRTPTPTGRPEVIDPTFAPGSIPRGDLRFGITPSPVYIETPHPSDPQLLQAFQFYHEKRYANAIDLLTKLEQDGEESIDLYYYLAMSHIRMNQWDEAKSVIAKGLGKNDAFAPLYVAQGLVYRNEGAVERAESALLQAKNLDPLLLDSYIALANLYMSDFRLDLAQEEITDAYSLNRYNYNVGLIITEGELALRRGENATAVGLGQKAYYIDPGSEEVNNFLGKARIAYGATGYAIVGLEDFLYTINIASAEAWSLLGKAYSLDGRVEDAYFAYQRALQLSDNVLDAVISRAYYNLESGKTEEAYEDFTQALAERPHDEDMLRNHAFLAFELGKYEETLADLEYLRQITTLDPEIEVLYVRSLVESGQYEKVLNPATDALELGLTQAQRGYILEASGRTFFRLDQLPEAQRDLTFALNAEQTGARYFYLAQVMAAQGDYLQAIRNLEWVMFWDKTFDYSFSSKARVLLREYRRIYETELTAGN